VAALRIRSDLAEAEAGERDRQTLERIDRERNAIINESKRRHAEDMQDLADDRELRQAGVPQRDIDARAQRRELMRALERRPTAAP
jgi:hypothetical protein